MRPGAAPLTLADRRHALAARSAQGSLTRHHVQAPPVAGDNSSWDTGESTVS
jgi:hypothetical protein